MWKHNSKMPCPVTYVCWKRKNITRTHIFVCLFVCCFCCCCCCCCCAWGVHVCLSVCLSVWVCVCVFLFFFSNKPSLFPPTDPNRNMCFMEKENPGIPHWKTGFFIACCVYLYRLLDDSRFLAAATRCADFALGTKDAGNWPMWGHKLAWGASELYAVTRDPKHLKMATELGLMLVHRQNEDGFFPYPEWYVHLPCRILSFCACMLAGLFEPTCIRVCL